MEAYKESLSKLTPDKLVNILLSLNDEHKKSDPSDTQTLKAIAAKIAALQESISTLKRDPPLTIDPLNLAKNTDVDKLERSRSGHMAQITTLLKKFNSLNKYLSTSTDEDRGELLVELDQIASSLSYQLTQIGHKTTKLELLLDEDSLSDLIKKNATYSEKVFKCKSRLLAIKEHEKVREQRQAKTVLPSISIQKFTPKGKLVYQEFQAFKASFESLFLNNDMYSQVQLFNYLLSFLGGSALELCQRYSIDQNFDTAYAELCNCYDRPDLLVSECLAHLESLEKPRGNAFSMRQLYLKQNQTVALLFKFIGGSLKVDESVLMRSLLCKVPYAFDKQYREYIAEKELERKKYMQIQSLVLDLQAMSTIIGHSSSVIPPSVDSEPLSSNVGIYFTFFEKYLNNLEYLEFLHPKSDKKRENDSGKPENSKRGANFAISKSAPKKIDKKVKFEKFRYLCNEKSHFTPFCQKQLGIKEKWKNFQKNNLCFNCGRKGHSSKDCFKSGACDKCSIRHLPILHSTPNPNLND